MSQTTHFAPGGHSPEELAAQFDTIHEIITTTDDVLRQPQEDPAFWVPSPEEFEAFYQRRTHELMHTIEGRYGPIADSRSSSHTSATLLQFSYSNLARTPKPQEGQKYPPFAERPSTRIMDLRAHHAAMLGWIDRHGWMDSYSTAPYLDERGRPVTADANPTIMWLQVTPPEAKVSIYVREHLIEAKDSRQKPNLGVVMVAVDWDRHSRTIPPTYNPPRPPRTKSGLNISGKLKR